MGWPRTGDGDREVYLRLYARGVQRLRVKINNKYAECRAGALYRTKLYAMLSTRLCISTLPLKRRAHANDHPDAPYGDDRKVEEEST